MFKLIILAAALLAGCSPKPDTPMQVEYRPQNPQPSDGRVIVKRIGVFADDAAYDGRRGIYVITDTKSGAEFIGVSGIGIAETGSHQAGKVRVRDER